MKRVVPAAAAAVILVFTAACSSAAARNGGMHTDSALEQDIPVDHIESVSVSSESGTFQTAELLFSSQQPETAETEQISEEENPPRAWVNADIDYQAFERRISEIAMSQDVTGMSLCVFANGEVIHSLSLGYADVEEGIPCGDETLYRMSSISKLVSTMALMTLYDDGVLDPYTELESLTGFPYNNPAFDEPVLLWHLLTHTAGITDNYAFEKGPSERYSLDYVLSTAYNGYRPGTFYIYSNFGMGTVGGIIERLTGEYFHDYAERVLFEPLGIDAGYCIDLVENRQNAANLYQQGELIYTPKSWGRASWYYESFGLGNSYLTANSELLITCSDLAKMGIILSGDGSVDGVSILSPDAVDTINSVYYSAPEGADPKNFDMGLCVRVYDDNLVKGRTIHGHPGQALGSVNGIYYDASDGTGVAICSVGSMAYINGGNGVYRLLDGCVNAVYDTFFEEDPA